MSAADSTNDLPTGQPPLIRTDFADDAAWQRLVALVTAETNADGETFVSRILVVDDPANRGTGVEQAPAGLSFLADSRALAETDHPVLVVENTDDAAQKSFRVVATELWTVENGLFTPDSGSGSTSLPNMDFDDFVDNLDSDGVFRGFRDY